MPGLKLSQNPDCNLNLWSFNWDHAWSQDLMKFLMSYHRKNSVRYKVIGKKWTYLERNTLSKYERASLIAQSVKNLPAMRDTWVWFLGWEDFQSILAWLVPWTEEPGGLQSMGLQRVRHDWMTSLSLFTFMHWRRKWQPTPVFLPGESQGRGSLVGCCLWGRTESDTTEVT